MWGQYPLGCGRASTERSRGARIVHIHTHACTVPLQVSTGEVLPHWAENDWLSRNYNPLEKEQMLLMYPAAAFEYGERYIVVIIVLCRDQRRRERDRKE